jgi:hypothetical protein
MEKMEAVNKLKKAGYQVQFDSIPTPRRIAFRAKLETI